ncbi:hypothetical protein Mapa_017518 [Marchantia paleacea]|nr:hypothetical protein Mapa_017518 [Marchantia paleacea]
MVFRATKGGTPSRLKSVWLSDSVNEMFKPENEDDILCEILFFHGLQVTADKKKVREAHRTTWLTADGKQCWLQTFLPDAFDRKVRVLSVTYDSAAFKTSSTGRFDLFLTGESLVGSVIRNATVNVGQRGVPVILVAHSFGGIAVKQMLVQAHHEMVSRRDPSPRIENFLWNVKGVFFYATPHLGASIADYQSCLPSSWKTVQGPVLEELLPLNPKGSRLNAKFVELKKKHQICSMCLIEKERMKLLGPISITVVDEGSARDISTEETRPIDADHLNICKPERETSERFTYLRHFIQGFVMESQYSSGEGFS